VDVQNLMDINLAVVNLCMPEETCFHVEFFIVNVSIYLSKQFFVGVTGQIFETILTHSGTNDVFLQPLMPVGVSVIHFNI